MTSRLHFHPIQGKTLDIIDAILHTREVAAVGQAMGVVHLTVEELVVNIVDYASTDYLDVEVTLEEALLTLRFRDGGMPFNPLEQEPPDTTLPMAQRKMGGYGILLVTKYAEAIAYERTDGENVLTVTLNTNKQPD